MKVSVSPDFVVGLGDFADDQAAVRPGNQAGVDLHAALAAHTRTAAIRWNSSWLR